MIPDNIQEIAGGVTAPLGFLAGAGAGGIKKPGRLDVAVVYSQGPAVAAAVYTTNKVQAAPIMLTREHLADQSIRAVVANSGNANACTGEKGLRDAREMAVLTGQLLDLPPTQVAVASTGVIGVYMPMERVREGIRQACANLCREGGSDAARAIMTTDTFAKEAAVQVELDGVTATIGAMVKGSGMIRPNMATMLGFITTDAAITGSMLQRALSEVTEATFNMLTVDGDTSTNDFVILLANGLAGNPPIEGAGPAYRAFVAGLTAVCTKLVRLIARDGEGATKLVTVEVKGAPTVADARKAALAVANSNLVKTALFGNDANWGRILAAVGYSGADFDPARVNIFLTSAAGTEQMARDGAGLAFDEEKARAIMQQEEMGIVVDLRIGPASATAWTCDFSYDYVRINADYRT